MSKEAEAKQFEILFTEDAKKDIDDLDGSVKKQLRNALVKKLSVDPEAYGTPLRSPLAGYWKDEFADHRIIYRIQRKTRQVVVVCAVGVCKAGNAADIYRQLMKIVESGRLAQQVMSVLEVISPELKKK